MMQMYVCVCVLYDVDVRVCVLYDVDVRVCVLYDVDVRVCVLYDVDVRVWRTSCSLQGRYSRLRSEMDVCI